MRNIGIFMISCAAVLGGAANLAFADDEAAQGAQASTAEPEIGVPPPPAPHPFHIRLINTQLCLQPQNDSRGQATLVLEPCVTPSSPANDRDAQTWMVSTQSGGTEIVNVANTNCMYNPGSSPPTNGTGPVLQSGCNVFGTQVPASNALWNLTGNDSNTVFRTQIGHKDTGFCLDVPGDNAFAGATLQIFTCNNSGAQSWTLDLQ